MTQQSFLARYGRLFTPHELAALPPAPTPDEQERRREKQRRHAANRSRRATPAPSVAD